jgi:uncharacterized membrane-anchored protein YitT (DUF2179 family)
MKRLGNSLLFVVGWLLLGLMWLVPATLMLGGFVLLVSAFWERETHSFLACIVGGVVMAGIGWSRIPDL